MPFRTEGRIGRQETHLLDTYGGLLADGAETDGFARTSEHLDYYFSSAFGLPNYTLLLPFAPRSHKWGTLRGVHAH